MNNQRRKEIRNIINELEIVKGKIEKVCGDEEDYYDNIPENLQESDRAVTSEEAIDYLNEAVENIESVISNLEDID